MKRQPSFTLLVARWGATFLVETLLLVVVLSQENIPGEFHVGAQKGPANVQSSAHGTCCFAQFTLMLSALGSMETQGVGLSRPIGKSGRGRILQYYTSSHIVWCSLGFWIAHVGTELYRRGFLPPLAAFRRGDGGCQSVRLRR